MLKLTFSLFMEPKAQSGTAAMEVLLSLPFFLVVMLIGLNFGKDFLLQQKAMVAARYAAWHEARTGEPVTRRELQRAGYEGHAVRVTTKRSATRQQAATNLQLPDVMSNTQTVGVGFNTEQDSTKATVTVSYGWRPLGSILPEARPSGTCFLNLEDWRYRHGKGELDPVLHGLHSGLETVVEVISK